jgi:hypothetical protein
MQPCLTFVRWSVRRRPSPAIRGVWHAGYEHAREAELLAERLQSLWAERQRLDHEIKCYQRDYESVTGEVYEIEPQTGVVPR